LQSVPPAKLSAPVDVKLLRSKPVDAIHAPRIVMEKRGLLGAEKSREICFEAIEDRIEGHPHATDREVAAKNRSSDAKHSVQISATSRKLSGVGGGS
jgi:hypothetical protein